jgi:hypothetical protein
MNRSFAPQFLNVESPAPNSSSAFNGTACLQHLPPLLFDPFIYPGIYRHRRKVSQKALLPRTLPPQTRSKASALVSPRRILPRAAYWRDRRWGILLEESGQSEGQE